MMKKYHTHLRNSCYIDTSPNKLVSEIRLGGLTKDLKTNEKYYNGEVRNEKNKD